MKNSSYRPAGTRGRSRFILRALKFPGLLVYCLAFLAFFALLLIDYAGGYSRRWHRDGYVIECQRDRCLDKFGGNPVWKGTLKGTDGNIFHFSADGRYRFLCFRRGYYGWGPPSKHRADISIKYSTNPNSYLTDDDVWYVQSKLAPVGERLAGLVTQPGRKGQPIRLYYQPFSHWVVDYEFPESQ